MIKMVEKFVQRINFINQEEFDGRLCSGGSVLICLKVTEKDKPRDADMKGICGKCNATIFFSRSSEKAKMKICQECGIDLMLMDFIAKGKMILNASEEDKELVK
jgi:hypothetical protein